jgi:hypothetical protein
MFDMSRFEGRLRSLLDQTTTQPTLHWNISNQGVSFLEVTPMVEGQLPFSVAWSEHEVVIAFHGYPRIELGPPWEDGDLALRIVGAILAGRVKERGEKRRSSMTIELADGSVWVERATMHTSGQVVPTGGRTFLPY